MDYSNNIKKGDIFYVAYAKDYINGDDVSVIDGYITNGTEEPVYKEFITNDYYKKLNGTISPYKAKSTERAIRNETGIHADYISMMAVFYKILFNGHYMDV